METAIHTGSDSIFASYKKLQQRPEIKKEISKSDRLASLSTSDDWKALQEVIDAHIQQLTDLRSVSPEDTVEAVGFRYLASQIAIEHLKEIRNLPDRVNKQLKQKDGK